MKKSLVGLLVLLSIASYAQSPRFNNKRMIVKLKTGQELPIIKNAKKVKNLFANVYVIYTDHFSKLESELKNSIAFEYIEKDFYSGQKSLPTVTAPTKMLEDLKVNSAFNDPKVSRIWSFNDSSKNGISITKTYLDLPTQNKTEIIVAVVDTGVDYNHEDLKNSMWINHGEIAGNGIDDDNNGYIDDIHGIDTLERDQDGEATGDPMDTHSHGTHVSGTIAAQQNNGVGIAGIAEKVKIMAIRTVPNRSDETDVDVVESFIYAAKNGAKIINCSFGKQVNEGGLAVQDAIDFIGKNYGVLVVAAAGNDSKNIDKRLTYPASFTSENLMVVASTTNRGRMSGFSNYGAINVDIAAPGSSIYSTTPNNRYGNMSGTSMASPTAAGVAAEVLSRFPHLGPVELKKILMRNVSKVRSFSGQMVSGGRIDLFQTIQDLD